MRAVEAARAEVESVLAFMRARNETSVELWRPRHLRALGLVNAASAKATYIPKASRCGWCSQLSLEDRSGGCNATCGGIDSCSISCAGQPPKQCLNYGFAYVSTVSDTGVWQPQVGLGLGWEEES